MRGTGQAGFYIFLAGDSSVSIVALNPPRAESRLAPLEADDYREAVGPQVIGVDRKSAWTRAIYRVRQGPELWWPFLMGAVALLLIESLMATSGRRDGRHAQRQPARASASDAAD